MQKHKIERSSLQADVVTKLREELVDGVWRPGVRLQERLLCERYGISRSPLREAFQVLASEGLIDILLNRGVVVSNPSPALVLQNYVLLQTLEILALELACENASDEQIARVGRANAAMKQAAVKGDMNSFFHDNNVVHRLIVEASGNAPLMEAHGIVSRQIIRMQNLSEPIERPVRGAGTDHDGFIKALIARDSVRALNAFEKHHKVVEGHVKRHLQTFTH
jgi:DNA-binding GntR family transcriptional regulator